MSETTAAKLADTLRELLPPTAEGERVFDEVAALLRSRDEEAGKTSRKLAREQARKRAYKADLERERAFVAHYSEQTEALLACADRLKAERDAAVQEAGKMRDALQATEDDALALLDQHVSPEVHKETRLRIIERIQARDAAADREAT